MLKKRATINMGTNSFSTALLLRGGNINQGGFVIAPILSLLCILLLGFPGCGVKSLNLTSVQVQSLSNTADEFQNPRSQMVQQLREHGIQDKAVLEAMAKVPRHQFVAASQTHLAYRDSPLPIAHDQTISQPYIVAYMTAAAAIASNEKVLEIGTGSGYQAAVLGEVAKEVYTIEIIPELAARARKTLSDLGYKNIHVKAGNGYQGWAEHAPYDAIIVTAAPDQIPEALINQLALNGKMVIPVGTWNQEMIIVTKTPDGLIEQRTIPVRFVPMTGKE
jgi:protein-L-isoaspartate(D-aspartate) O-methyltransferase